MPVRHIGIQSADEEQRRKTLNRNYTNDQARRTVSLLKERKIAVSADHIIGLPGDTTELLRSAIGFYNELRPERLLTFWLTYYPGTEIMEKALESGLITQDDRERIESGRGGHRYSGGGASRINEALLRFPFFFALIPLLPPGAIRWLLKRNFGKNQPEIVRRAQHSSVYKRRPDARSVFLLQHKILFFRQAGSMRI